MADGSTRSRPRRALCRSMVVGGVAVALLTACAGTPEDSDGLGGAALAPAAAQPNIDVSGAAVSAAVSLHVLPVAARPPDPIARRIAHMTLRDKVRQLIVVAFGGKRAPVALIRRLHPGGLIYFSPNLRSTAQIRAMSRQAQRTARRTGQPLLLMTDQEGGLVTRLPGTSHVPGGADFHGNAAWARRTAVRTGRDLVRVGINVDLAPVADVNTVGSRGVIGPRSFSSNPQVAARLTRAQVCGYHQGGVAATVKHFPGHGSTTTDSHRRPARIRESRARWRRTDLPPFTRAVASRVDLVMLGHLAFPAIDRTGRPATISPRLDRRLLRAGVGYDGVVITDALNMGGITAFGSTGSIAVRAIRSGVDLLLMPPNPASAVHGLVSAVQHGRISEGRLNTSVHRILALKQRLGLFRAAKHLHQCR